MKKGLSSRFHLALGLSMLVVSLMLLALNFGLVPDRDGALRSGRTALAESMAMGATLMLAADAEMPLRRWLGFVRQRNPQLLSIGVRRADGSLLIDVGEHAQGWRSGAGAAALPGQLEVPILQGDAAWGRAELRFEPLPSEGAWSLLASAPVQLVAALGFASFGVFYLYLRRMLRHLDPSQSVPGRVRNAFNSLAEGLLVLDHKGQVMLANQAFAEVLGRPADSLLGQRAASLPWTNQARSRIHRDATPWALTQRDGRSRHNVLLYLEAADATRRTFMVNCTPVATTSGSTAGVLVSLDDVTELEEKEIELRIARDEAESANRAKSDFLAHMSHEIRTPMNAILGFTELLRRGYQHSAEDARRYLDIIHGSGRHLLELINDILDLSKVEAGRLELEHVPCAAHRVVLDVVQVMKVKAEEKGVGLVAEFPHGLSETVTTDPARLRQIVTNLVGNALKFTERGGVTVRVSIDPGIDRGPRPAQLVIEVVDTGIGVPANKLEAIFEPFVQAEASTTREFGGTGLGLAISRRFARALGGDIVASSVAGQGSTFRVSLDAGELAGVAWLEPAQLAAAEQAVAAPRADSWQLAASHVLVVDDGVENRELVRLVLEAAGLRVTQAENGAEALERIAADRFDLVLMDVQMPVMDGFTATRVLRQRGQTMPVIAFTANAMKGFEAEIEAAGFSGFLTKPVDIDALLAALAGHLGGQRVDAASAVPAAPLWVAAPDAGLLPNATAALVPSAPDAAPGSAAAAAAPGSDARPVTSRLAHHPRLVHVVRSFALQLPDKLQAMADALKRRDLAELEALAHWLKGAGGTVGFDEFYEPALAFEGHAQAGDIGALERSLQALRTLAARIEIPVVPPGAAPRPDPAAAARGAHA